MAVAPPVEALLRRAAEALPESLRQVARTEVAVRATRVEEGRPALEDAYVARLELERTQPVGTYLLLSKPLAIALAGLLVMMQEKVVREKVEQGEVTDDDLESLAECAGHVSTVFDEALAENLGEGHELGFVEGGFDVAVEDGDYVRLEMDLALGDLAEGLLVWLVPAEGIEADEAPAPEAADAPPGGVELTAEEMAAIREVAREASFGGSVAVLAPVERVRAAWDRLGRDAGAALEVVRTIFELRRAAATAELEAVIVDGDVLPGGGVAAVEVVGRWAARGVPVLMAASRPTRRHVAASLAAGAAGYLVKPCAPEDLGRALERLARGAAAAQV